MSFFGPTERNYEEIKNILINEYGVGNDINANIFKNMANEFMRKYMSNLNPNIFNETEENQYNASNAINKNIAIDILNSMYNKNVEKTENPQDFLQEQAPVKITNSTIPSDMLYTIQMSIDKLISNVNELQKKITYDDKHIDVYVKTLSDKYEKLTKAKIALEQQEHIIEAKKQELIELKEDYLKHFEGEIFNLNVDCNNNVIELDKTYNINKLKINNIYNLSYNNIKKSYIRINFLENVSSDEFNYTYTNCKLDIYDKYIIITIYEGFYDINYFIDVINNLLNNSGIIFIGNNSRLFITSSKYKINLTGNNLLLEQLGFNINEQTYTNNILCNKLNNIFNPIINIYLVEAETNLLCTFDIKTQVVSNKYINVNKTTNNLNLLLTSSSNKINIDNFQISLTLVSLVNS